LPHQRGLIYAHFDIAALIAKSGDSLSRSMTLA